MPVASSDTSKLSYLAFDLSVVLPARARLAAVPWQEMDTSESASDDTTHDSASSSSEGSEISSIPSLTELGRAAAASESDTDSNHSVGPNDWAGLVAAHAAHRAALAPRYAALAAANAARREAAANREAEAASLALALRLETEDRAAASAVASSSASEIDSDSNPFGELDRRYYASPGKQPRGRRGARAGRGGDTRDRRSSSPSSWPASGSRTPRGPEV